MHICHNRYNCLGAVLTHRPPHVLVAMTDAAEEVKAGVPDGSVIGTASLRRQVAACETARLALPEEYRPPEGSYQ